MHENKAVGYDFSDIYTFKAVHDPLGSPSFEVNQAIGLLVLASYHASKVSCITKIERTARNDKKRLPPSVYLVVVAAGPSEPGQVQGIRLPLGQSGPGSRPTLPPGKCRHPALLRRRCPKQWSKY